MSKCNAYLFAKELMDITNQPLKKKNKERKNYTNYSNEVAFLLNHCVMIYVILNNHHTNIKKKMQCISVCVVGATL